MIYAKISYELILQKKFTEGIIIKYMDIVMVFNATFKRNFYLWFNTVGETICDEYLDHSLQFVQT